MSRLSDWLKETQELFGEAFYSAEQTDCYDAGDWNQSAFDKIREENLLVLRVFNDAKEIRISRSDIGADPKRRILVDADEKREHFDEWQLLDQRDIHDSGRIVKGIHGSDGAALESPAVQIRYYTDRQEDPHTPGLTYISDWRCVKFCEWRDQ